MPEPTLADEIITLINSEANNNPAPIHCTITKVYSDNNHVDATTSIGTLEYIPTITNTPHTNTEGIIIFPEGDQDSPVILPATPNKWTKKELNTYADLWVNPYLRLCKLRYTRTFGSATGDTYYTWHTGLIPTTYRPPHQVQGAFNTVGTLIITNDGDIMGKFANTWSSSRTVIGECIWWY